MPHDDEWADGLGWSEIEERLFEDIGERNELIFQDDLLQQAFDLGWFDMDIDHEYREAAREFVYEYLETEYGIDFDEVFDWDAWREAYG